MDRDRTVHRFEASSDDPGASWKNTTIAVRSNRDRRAFNAESTPRVPDSIFVMIFGEKDAQSTHDQATIVVDRGRSRRKAWPGRSGKHGEIKANSWPIPKLRRRPKESLPLPIKPPPRSPSIGHDLWANFFFKTQVFLLSFFTFDRFLKELSEFRGRSLVHRDPSAFRLNSEGIGAGFITNSSLISSNFPHEFRKSVRKDPSKFSPIRANWSLILVAIGLVVRFGRLSRGNLSFY